MAVRRSPWMIRTAIRDGLRRGRQRRGSSCRGRARPRLPVQEDESPSVTASPWPRFGTTVRGYVRRLPALRAEGVGVAREQGHDIGPGSVPGPKTERVYRTTIAAA